MSLCCLLNSVRREKRVGLFYHNTCDTSHHYSLCSGKVMSQWPDPTATQSSVWASVAAPAAQKWGSTWEKLYWTWFRRSRDMIIQALFQNTCSNQSRPLSKLGQPTRVPLPLWVQNPVVVGTTQQKGNWGAELGEEGHSAQHLALSCCICRYI